MRAWYVRVHMHIRTQEHSSVLPAGILPYVSHLPCGSLWLKVFFFLLFLLAETMKLLVCSPMKACLPVHLLSYKSSHHASEDTSCFPPKGNTGLRIIFLKVSCNRNGQLHHNFPEHNLKLNNYHPCLFSKDPWSSPPAKDFCRAALMGRVWALPTSLRSSSPAPRQSLSRISYAQLFSQKTERPPALSSAWAPAP